MSQAQRSENKTLVFADSDNGGVIHVANIKGGVGKSTVATNLGAALAKKGPTLVIDLDVQGSATHALGKEPSEFTFSSWDLLCRRYCIQDADDCSRRGWMGRMRGAVSKAEASVLSGIVGNGEITSLCVSVAPALDLVPANSDLFKPVGRYQVQNLLYNLDICRIYYKYIVIDTPSVWNLLTKSLFLRSDLNLVPVTLNALSTRSLRDYLLNVKRLALRRAGVRVRIVKNEVFGSQASKIKGKTRTMNENRRFLERLCEQSVIKTNAGISVLPQSILFDLEIPESAIVRDAQDEGKSVHDFQQYSAVTKAFDELSKRVQYVLNMPIQVQHLPFWLRYQDAILQGSKIAAVFVLAAVLMANRPVSHFTAPRPIAPQQLVVSKQQIITHQFKGGESLFRVAKYAICHFRAVVPTIQSVNEYVDEILTVYNRTRMTDETALENPNSVPAGTVITLYPPTGITNPREDELRPVYQFFTGLVSDQFSYVTGDWCERGTGGGKPHYGIDVAANFGSEIYSPIEGTAVLDDGSSGGRTVGIEIGGTVLFFCHMDKRFVKNGDRITKGQALGTVGMTGNTSGPHAHIGYGIRVPSGEVTMGKYLYKITDPKLFFYREQYIARIK